VLAVGDVPAFNAAAGAGEAELAAGVSIGAVLDGEGVRGSAGLEAK
jgi:hypothetical protein